VWVYTHWRTELKLTLAKSKIIFWLRVVEAWGSYLSTAKKKRK
jgi:hypothetical protein